MTFLNPYPFHTTSKSPCLQLLLMLSIIIPPPSPPPPPPPPPLPPPSILHMWWMKLTEAAFVQKMVAQGALPTLVSRHPRQTLAHALLAAGGSRRPHRTTPTLLTTYVCTQNNDSTLVNRNAPTARGQWRFLTQYVTTKYFHYPHST